MKEVVTVPYGVKRIAERAFFDRTYIKEVVLPNSVECIERYAFAYCKGLEKIEASEHLAIVEADAFDNVPDNAFNYYEGGLYLGNEKHPYHCFVRPAAAAKAVHIHNECRMLADSAFSHDDCLELVTITHPITGRYQAVNTQRLTISESVSGVLDLLPYTYSVEITVVSDGSDTEKCIIPAYSDKTTDFDEMLHKCWGEGNTFNFNLFDEYFENIHSPEAKLKIALTRIRHPYDLSEEAEVRFKSFVSSKSKQIIIQCIDENDLELMYFMGSNGLIKKTAVKELISTASGKGKTAITAYLLEYNNRLLNQ